MIEYNNPYSRKSGTLWQCYWHEPALDKNDNITDFPANGNNSILFEFKQHIAGQTRNGGTKDVEIILPLKYLSSFWRILEMMPLINYDISL